MESVSNRNTPLEKTVTNKKDMCFLPLGGAETIGDSAYFLKLGDMSILLDCGAFIKSSNILRLPKFELLTQHGLINELSDLDTIILSHSHVDHTAGLYFLDQLMNENDINRPVIYSTPITRVITEMQLHKIAPRRDQWMVCQAMRRFRDVAYMKPIRFKDCKLQFMPAGHTVGSMMTYIRYNKKTILYTGDITCDDTPLTPGCIIPDIPVDYMILNGTFAMNSVEESDKQLIKLEDKVNEILQYIHDGKSVNVMCNNVGKGAELIKALNVANQNHVANIFIDESFVALSHQLEKSRISILGKHNFVIHKNRVPQDINLAIPQVIISRRRRKEDFSGRELADMTGEFTAHMSRDKLADMITRINPKEVFIVHYAKEWDKNKTTLEQIIAESTECDTKVTFAKQGEIYKLA